MHDKSPNERLVVVIFLVLVSIILIPPQFPIASAGACGGPEGDCDQDSFTPNEGDCDDYNPNVYPGHGSCSVPIAAINDVIIDLKDLTDEGTITSSQAQALLVKLDSAIKKIESDKIEPAIGSLNAFINQVTAFINSGKISSSVGNSLIVDVKNIIDTLRMG